MQMEVVGEAVEVLLSCLCCSAARASWHSSMLVTVWVPIFSRRQRFEASVCPFDQAQGWLQLVLSSSCAGR